MTTMPNHYQPLSKRAGSIAHLPSYGSSLSLSVFDGIRFHHVVAFLLALLCIPVLFLLDAVFFQFTRPSCAGCASFGHFLANNSITIAFIQSGELTGRIHNYFVSKPDRSHVK